MRLDSLLMLGLQPNLPAATPTPTLPRAWDVGERARCTAGWRFQAAYLSMFLITPITLREMVRVICLLIWSPTESARS